MRVTAILFAVLLSVPGLASAQEWQEFVFQQDGISVNFPRKPTITETTWTSQLRYTLPARVYSVENGPERYSMTVVDYKDIEKLSADRAAQCQKSGGEGDACMNSWRSDVAGAIVFGTWRLMQRDAKVTFYGFMIQDLVSGHQIQLLNADQSRTFAAVNMHLTKLYILEATVPRGLPAPGLFQQSLMFLDEKGQSIRYRSYYSHTYSDEWKFPAAPPPRTR